MYLKCKIKISIGPNKLVLRIEYNLISCVSRLFFAKLPKYFPDIRQQCYSPPYESQESQDMSQQVTTSGNNVMTYPESNIILITIILTPLAPSNFGTQKGKEKTKLTLDLVRQNILENERDFGYT